MKRSKIILFGTAFLLLAIIIIYCKNTSHSANVELRTVEFNGELTDYKINQRGKNFSHTAMVISSNAPDNVNVYYSVNNGQPNELCVIEAWIATKEFSASDEELGIAIMVDDKSDYNSGKVYSERISEDTNGWRQLKRIVKLNDSGELNFYITTGINKSLSEGTVIIDKVSAYNVTNSDDYQLLRSRDSTIRMVFANEDLNSSGISRETFNYWIEIYANIRENIKDLLGGRDPYGGTTDFIMTENLLHYGLAGNPIYIDKDQIREQLSTIQLDYTNENNNIIWEPIHEMSHTFDGIENECIYNFDKEFFATFKCLYGLCKTDYGFGFDMYTGENILMHFKESKDYLNNGVYNYESFLYRLIEIISNDTDSLGYNAVKQTFNDMLNISDANNIPYSEYEKFIYFINVISQKSGITVEQQFTPKEWDTLTQHFFNSISTSSVEESKKGFM